jgi:hypothetical protein
MLLSRHAPRVTWDDREYAFAYHVVQGAAPSTSRLDRVAAFVLRLWWEAYTFKLNMFGYRHWRSGNYELAILVALTRNLSGLGIYIDIAAAAIELAGRVMPIGVPSEIRFIYYAIALFQVPIQIGVSRDVALLVFLVATDRLQVEIIPDVVWTPSLFWLPLIVMSPHACNWLSGMTMPVQWALFIIAMFGWGFHLLRLVPGAKPGRWRTLVVIFASLTHFIITTVDAYYPVQGFPRGRAPPRAIQ